MAAMTTEFALTRDDKLPTGYRLQAHWQDRGCRFSPSCLNCPLPECLDGNIHLLHQEEIAERKQKVKALKGEGLPIPEIAARLGVSTRTIARDLSGKSQAKRRSS